MIKLFAKYSTTDKVLLTCERSEVKGIMIMLNKKFGGSWVLVDKIDVNSELLKFDDKLPYNGFTGKGERYVNGIHKLK